MYPNLYYVFKDWFGVQWKPLSFLNTFGFMVAMGFIVSAIAISSELKRKEKQGLLLPREESITVGKSASFLDLLINFLTGFLFGYKLIGLFFSKPDAVSPQTYIFSAEGNLFAGLALGLGLAGLKWWEKNKQKLAKPEKRIVRIWPQDRVGEITILALVFGLLGAKLFDIFENWGDFLQHPSDYIFSAKGLTFYGGLICAGLAIWWYARKHKIGFWHLNDTMAPTMMLAYSLGRIGCQVSGDGDWGIENINPKPFSWLPDWMWSYTYPHNVNEVGVKIAGCTDSKFCNELPVGVYPTSFYEIVLCFILFLVIWSVRKKFKVPGTLFGLYLIFNGLERFFIEKIRVNSRLDIFGLLPTQAEIISSLLFLTGVAIWIILARNAKISKTSTAVT